MRTDTAVETPMIAEVEPVNCLMRMASTSGRSNVLKTIVIGIVLGCVEFLLEEGFSRWSNR